MDPTNSKLAHFVQKPETGRAKNQCNRDVIWLLCLFLLLVKVFYSLQKTSFYLFFVLLILYFFFFNICPFSAVVTLFLLFLVCRIYFLAFLIFYSLYFYFSFSHSAFNTFSIQTYFLCFFFNLLECILLLLLLLFRFFVVHLLLMIFTKHSFTQHKVKYGEI